MGTRVVLSKSKNGLVRIMRRIKRLVCFDETRDIYHGDSFKSYWDEYYGQAHRSLFSSFKLKVKAKTAFWDEGFRLDEFYLLGLENKNKKERCSFLSRNKKDDILISYYGGRVAQIIKFIEG